MQKAANNWEVEFHHIEVRAPRFYVDVISIMTAEECRASLGSGVV